MQHIRRTLLLILCLAALGFGAGLISPTAPATAAAQGATDAWVPIAVLYTSDIKGHIEPCG